MDYGFDLQLFSWADETTIRVGEIGKNTGFVGTSTGTSAKWVSDGDELGFAGTALTYASWDSGNLIVDVANGTFSVDTSGAAVNVFFGTAGTFGSDKAAGSNTWTNTPAVKAKTAGAIKVNSVAFEQDGTEEGSLSYDKSGALTGLTGTMTVGSFTGGLAVSGLTVGATGSLSFGSAKVELENATGTFKDEGKVYSFTMADDKAQKFVGTSGHKWNVTGGSKADTIGAGTTSTGFGATITAGAGADVVWAFGDNAYVEGNDGNDFILVGDQAKNVTILGGDGNDTIGGGADMAKVIGSSTLNTVLSQSAFVGSGASIDGGAGKDVILIGGDKNVVNGGDGDDKIYAFGGGKNSVAGGEGKDTFYVSEIGGTLTITDYNVGADKIVVANTTIAQATVAAGTQYFTANGELAVAAGAAGSGYVSLKTEDNSNGFYAADLTDETNSVYVAWVGADSTTIDASSFTKPVVLQGVQNKDNGDLLMGGSGADIVFAGKNDSVVAGAGNDMIHAGSFTGVQVGLNTSSGKDTVDGYIFGFDLDKSDGVQILDFSDVASISASVVSGGTITIQDGSSSNSLTLVEAAGGASRAVEVLVNNKKLALAGSAATITASAADYADFYWGTKASMVDFSAVDDSVSVNLSDTTAYRNIATVKGGKADTTLMGSSAKESLVSGGGNTTLWGGAGNDTLVGIAKGKDVFALASGDGKNVFDNFETYTSTNEDTADALYLYGGAALKSIVRNSGSKLTVTLDTGDTATITTSGSGKGADDLIQFTTDGSNMGYAKIGMASSANTFTYDAKANFYLGGTAKDVVSISGSDSDDRKIWLDGSQGGSYVSIDVIDATASTGNNQLVGDSESQTIKAGQGNDSLWGGAGNAADTLQSGKGDTTFFYLKGNGNDVMRDVKDSDLVNLLDITLDDIKSADFSSSGLTVGMKNGDTFQIKKAATASTVTVALGDGSKWTGTYSTKSWAQA